jgi:hypothetical protein
MSNINNNLKYPANPSLTDINGTQSDDKSDDQLANIMGMMESEGELPGVIKKDMKKWSPTDEMKKIISKQNGSMNLPDFQNFTTDMINKKCWNTQDVYEFITTVQKLKDLCNKNKSDESLKQMRTLEHRNMLLKLQEKVDTMNVVSAYNGKCNMIQDKAYKREMIKFVRLVNKLIDMYLPILAAISIQMNEFVQNASETYQLDPSYEILLDDTRKKILDTILTKKIRSIEAETGKDVDFNKDTSKETELVHKIQNIVNTSDKISSGNTWFNPTISSPETINTDMSFPETTNIDTDMSFPETTNIDTDMSFPETTDTDMSSIEPIDTDTDISPIDIDNDISSTNTDTDISSTNTDTGMSFPEPTNTDMSSIDPIDIDTGISSTNVDTGISSTNTDMTSTDTDTGMFSEYPVFNEPIINTNPIIDQPLTTNMDQVTGQHATTTMDMDMDTDPVTGQPVTTTMDPITGVSISIDQSIDTNTDIDTYTNTSMDPITRVPTNNTNDRKDIISNSTTVNKNIKVGELCDFDPGEYDENSAIQTMWYSTIWPVYKTCKPSGETEVDWTRLIILIICLFMIIYLLFLSLCKIKDCRK